MTQPSAFANNELICELVSRGFGVARNGSAIAMKDGKFVVISKIQKLSGIAPHEESFEFLSDAVVVFLANAKLP